MTPRANPGALVAITGAARGVGAATARRLHGVGYRVLALDRDPAVNDVAAMPGGAYVVDVADEAAVQRVVADLIAAHGVPDVWVNNAGFGQWGPFDPTLPGSERAEMAVNYHGSVHCIRAILPHWQARGRGHLVQVTSSAALVPAPRMATYAASKAAISSLVRSLRVELRGSGIAISEVIPNAIDSEMTRGDNAAHIPRLALLRPMLTVEEVAAAIHHAIERRPRALHLPRLLWPSYLLGVLFPGVLERFLAWGSVGERKVKSQKSKGKSQK